MSPKEAAKHASKVINPEGQELSEEEVAERVEAFGQALYDQARPLWHQIQNQGYAAGQKQAATKQRQAEQELEEAQQELKEKEQELEQLREEQPDVDKIHDDYQAKLDEAQERADQAAERLKRERLSTVTERLRSILNSSLDDDYADVKVSQAKRDRLRTTEDGYEVLAGADSEARIAAPQDTDPVQALADELIKGAPPKFKRSTVDDGSGARPGNAGGSKGSDVMKKAREEGREAAKKESAENDREHFYLGSGKGAAAEDERAPAYPGS